MEKLIKKLKRNKTKALKYRALYIKWLAREQEAARELKKAYYSEEETRIIALEILHGYGISKEVMELEEDEDEHDTETSQLG